MTEPTATMPSITTQAIDVPGATVTYDVRDNGSADQPVLFLIGSPMGAGGFATLASHFPDRTVATYDPRGVERSAKDDPSSESTPEQHGDDIHAVIEAIGRGPVDLFASSGGAVNALALVARHPDDVRILVAHEPPLAALVPDRAAALAATEDIAATYQREGTGPAMAKFIMIVGHRGPIPANFGAQPVDPAMFGLPTADDGSRNDALLQQNIITGTHYEPDIAALKAAPTTIVVAVGEESDGQLARRGGEAVAQLLGSAPVVFPSDHGGFLGGEYGQAGKPDEFAAKLREVLATNTR
jgi:pimeloyl-ACP methyl ester carboxylesterase